MQLKAMTPTGKWTLFIFLAVAFASEKNDRVNGNLNADFKGPFKIQNFRNKLPSFKNDNGPLVKKMMEKSEGDEDQPDLRYVKEKPNHVTTPFKNRKRRGQHNISGSVISGGRYSSSGNPNERNKARQECGTVSLPKDGEIVIYSMNDQFQMKCNTIIKSPKGTNITIKCPHFDLASKGCKKEKLTLEDSAGKIKKKMCKRETVSFTTTSNRLEIYHIREELKKKENTGGFICSVSVGRDPKILGDCGTYEVTTEKKMALIYSNNDGSRRKCKYNFRGPKGSKLKLSCPVFELHSPGCKKEKLILTDNMSDDKRTYCPNDPAPHDVIPSNSFSIEHLRKPLREMRSGGFLCYVTAKGSEMGLLPETSLLPETNSLTESTAMPLKPSRLFCDNCGKAQVTMPRMVGGENATLFEYPWSALLYSISLDMCSGTLIKKDWILTAAHCFDKHGLSPITVWLGSQKGRDFEHPDVKKILTSLIFIHPDYDNVTYQNDLALVRIFEVEFTNRIQPICLANIDDVAAGDKVVATGFGDLYEGDEKEANTLQEITLDVIEAFKCQSMYQDNYSITEDMICTLTDGKDSCKGHSGGPLIKQQDDGRYTQIGILSYGRVCALPTMPGVYTKVANYIDWIRETTKDSPPC